MARDSNYTDITQRASEALYGTQEEINSDLQGIADLQGEIDDYRAMDQGDYKVPGLGEVDLDQGRLAQAGSSFVRGATDVLAGGLSGLGRLDDYLTSKFGGGIQLGGGEYKSAFRSAGESVRETGQLADVNPQLQDEFLSTQLPAGLGSFAGFAVGGTAGLASKAAGYAVPATIGIGAMGEEQIADFERVTGRQATPDEAGKLLAYSAPLGATEAIPLARAFTRTGGRLLKNSTIDAFKQSATKAMGTQMAKSGTVGAAEEALQESIQQIGSNLIASDIAEYDRERDMLEGLSESASVGGAVGFLVNAVAGGLGLRQRAGQRDRAMAEYEQRLADIRDNQRLALPYLQEEAPILLGQDQEPPAGPAPTSPIAPVTPPTQGGEITAPRQPAQTPEGARQGELMGGEAATREGQPALTTAPLEGQAVDVTDQRSLEFLWNESDYEAAMGMMQPLYEPVVRTKWGNKRKANLDSALAKLRQNVASARNAGAEMTPEESQALKDVFTVRKAVDEVVREETRDVSEVIDTSEQAATKPADKVKTSSLKKSLANVTKLESELSGITTPSRGKKAALTRARNKFIKDYAEQRGVTPEVARTKLDEYLNKSPRTDRMQNIDVEQAAKKIVEKVNDIQQTAAVAETSPEVSTAVADSVRRKLKQVTTGKNKGKYKAGRMQVQAEQLEEAKQVLAGLGLGVTNESVSGGMATLTYRPEKAPTGEAISREGVQVEQLAEDAQMTEAEAADLIRATMSSDLYEPVLETTSPEVQQLADLEQQQVGFATGDDSVTAYLDALESGELDTIGSPSFGQEAAEVTPETAPESLLTDKEQRFYDRVLDKLAQGKEVTDAENNRFLQLEEKLQGNDEVAQDVTKRPLTREELNELASDDGAIADDEILFMRSGIGVADYVPETKRNFTQAYYDNMTKFVANSVEKGVVFHGTYGDFNIFDMDMTEFGIHVGTRQAAVDRVSSTAEERAMVENRNPDAVADEATILPLYISLKNPIPMSDINDFSDPVMLVREISKAQQSGAINIDPVIAAALARIRETFIKDLRAAQDKGVIDTNDIYKKHSVAIRNVLVRAGFDGAVYRNDQEDRGNISYILFDPTQIKHAELNLGTFDPKNTDMYQAIRRDGIVGLRKTEKIKAQRLAGRLKERMAKSGVRLTVAFSWDDRMPLWAQNQYNEWMENYDLKSIYSTKGMIRGNEVVILGNNVETAEQLQEVFFHEVVGHYSMEAMFGDNYNKLLDKVVAQKEFRSSINEVASIYDLDIRTTKGSRTAAKEFIASLAESGQHPGLLRRIVAWVRHQLRKIGIVTALNENDLRGYIAKAAKRLDAKHLDPDNVTDSDIMYSIASTAPGAKNRADVADVAERVGGIQMDKNFYRNNWEQRTKETFDAIAESKWFNWYGALRGLADKRAYRTIRAAGLGDKASYDSYADMLFEKFNGLKGDDKARLLDFMTTRDADPAILPEDIREDAIGAKNAIRELGQELVTRGALNKDTYQANEGSYLGRQYLLYMMDDKNFARAVSGGGKVSFMNYLKKRKDLPEELKTMLGRVEDPALLIPHTIATIGRDVALLDIMSNISAHSAKMEQDPWIFPDAQVDLGEGLGVRTVSDTLDLLNNVQERVVPYTTEGGKRQVLLDQVGDVERQIRTALAQQFGPEMANIDVKQYRKISDAKRHGAFKGQWIRKEIHDDLVASTAALAPDEGTKAAIDRWIGQNGKITRAHRIWKSTKTIFNPPTHVRNAISNFIMLDMSTSTNSFTLGKEFLNELNKVAKARSEGKRWREIDEFWAYAEDFGITESTFSASEAHMMRREWQKLNREGDWLDNLPNTKAAAWLRERNPTISGKLQQGMDAMGKYYQLSETMFKVMKVKDVVRVWEKNTGQKLSSLSEIDRRTIIANAIQEANHAILDYSEVPNFVRYLRNVPIGAPFLSFSYLVLPRVIENMARHPVKFAQYSLGPYMLGSLITSMGAFEGEDDWDELKEKLPSGLKEKGQLVPMPWRNEHGDPIIVDMGYFMPFAQYTETMRTYGRMARGEEDLSPISPLLQNFGLLSGPLPDTVNALRTGVDSFTGRPIVNQYDDLAGQSWDAFMYAWRMGMPTFMTDIGTTGKLIDSFTGGDVDPATGKPKRSLIAAGLSFGGVSVYEPDVAVSGRKNIAYLQSEYNKQKAAMNKEIREARAKGGSVQDLATLRKKHIELLRQRRERLANYRERSGQQ